MRTRDILKPSWGWSINLYFYFSKSLPPQYISRSIECLKWSVKEWLASWTIVSVYIWRERRRRESRQIQEEVKWLRDRILNFYFTSQTHKLINVKEFTWTILVHSILIAIIWHRHWYDPNFTDGKTDVWRGFCLFVCFKYAHVTQIEVSIRDIKIQIQYSHTKLIILGVWTYRFLC